MIKKAKKAKKPEEKPEKPGNIESEFRKEIGKINPYLCLVDSAVGFFVAETKSNSNQAKFTREIAGKYGHHNLYTEHLNLDDLRKFVHLNHIALINSKAESACKRVQEIIWKESKKVEENLKKEVRDHVKGDFYRRTILEIHCYNERNSSFAKKDADEKVNEQIFADYLGYTELKVLDYLRKIRNNEFHNSKDRNTDLLENFNAIDQDLLNKKYNLQLNEPKNIEFTDVLLLSKVWQECVRQICRKCLNTSDIYESLKLRYKAVSSKRRKNGIIQTLKQDYLQTDEEISIIMGNWVG
ncbi:MAG: hypothetical protein HEQ10_18895 [Dolichospermum sp. DEX182a]|nr:hypothetical protein [Dolichospermum sp. DEX182a]MBS9384883.1 hypothetical protein [Dolichospermum sp. BR01]